MSERILLPESAPVRAQRTRRPPRPAPGRPRGARGMHRAPRSIRAAVLALAAVAALAGCQREERRLRPPPFEAAAAAQPVRLVVLQPGVPLPARRTSAAYDNSAYAISEGQRLFSAYNCTGCHANGGGGMGPALIDSVWIYGSDPANIHETIVQGRPNGMPSFGGHIPDAQVWQLVAFVRALARLEPSTRIPPRTDHMQRERHGRAAEPARPRGGPTTTGSARGRPD